VTLFLLLAALVQARADPPAAATRFNARASELFEREPVLNAWALRFHDRNGDGWLTTAEATDAAEDFRQLADSDGDGRVTTAEYRAALAFVGGQ
jgi:hypothetical protein